MTKLQLIAIVSAILAVGFTIPCAVTSMKTTFGWNRNWMYGWRVAAGGCTIVAFVTTVLS